ncbi:MAG: hypothetical protein J7521_01175 [Caulobacter sp.]|nr:hypothetical protein [Caulobacter sp.]
MAATTDFQRKTASPSSKDAGKTRVKSESHGERLTRLARQADQVEGPDLAKLSREERRKLLFG